MESNTGTLPSPEKFYLPSTATKKIWAPVCVYKVKKPSRALMAGVGNWGGRESTQEGHRQSRIVEVLPASKWCSMPHKEDMDIRLIKGCGQSHENARKIIGPKRLKTETSLRIPVGTPWRSFKKL